MATGARADLNGRLAIRVLGPIEVLTPAGPVGLPSPKERGALAHLAARVGHTVTYDDLIETLWGESPPRTASKALQNHIVHLRRALEPSHNGTPEYLLTDPTGYRLAIPPEWVDACRFEHLVHLGRRAYQDGRVSAAADTLREALGLWRDRAYLGLESTPIGTRESRRLEELRMLALEDRVAADLDLGLAREVVPELDGLVQEEPLRERLWTLLVLALYQSGRQGDALSAYALARETFVEELGIEPGAELRRVHEQVLAQDSTLDAVAPIPPSLIPPRSPFVGRLTEMASLRAAWDRVITSGSPRTVLVRGPSGSGVGRLAAEFAAELSDHDVPVALVSARDPTGVTRPSLLVEDLRAHVPVLRHPTVDGPALHLLLALPDTDAAADQSLDLGPLSTHDASAILSEYVDSDTAEAAVSEVMASTGGWVGPVHEQALRLARDTAAAQVVTAVARAEHVQGELGQARADLRAGVSRFQEVTEEFAATEPGVCPWKGLTSYGVDDAPWFAGRERLVAELLTRVASSRVIAVVGSSGSGKTSLLRAGLLASLNAGALPGSEGWTHLTMRPGPHPMRELVQVALHRAEPPPDRVADLLQRAVFGTETGARSVLVIDQFEEVWTVCHDDAERDAFLAALSSFVESEANATVLIGVRSDHVGRLGDHAELSATIADATLLVGAPTASELRRSIEQPAARAGLVLDVGLADAIVDDAVGEPGALPLLSTALSELWTRRHGRHLTLAAYSGAGGLRAAVARIAERAYSSLGGQDQAAARSLFLRLAGEGQGDGVTRRRVPLTELDALPNRRVAAVVEPLTEARLLTVDEGHVEVAHEALFREWPRLSGWLEEEATVQSVRRRLASAATEWDDGGREPAELWQGTRLAAGVELLTAAPDEVTATERSFLAAGQDKLDAERLAAEEQVVSSKRQNTRLRRLLGGLVVVLVAASVAGGMAWRAEGEAARAARVASARELAAAARAVVEEDAELGILLATEAIDTTRVVDGDVLPQAEEALHRAVTAARVVDVFPGAGGALAWSPDGTFFVPEGPETSGRVEIHSAETGDVVRAWVGHDVDINDVFIAANGVVATSGDDGAAVAWDPNTGQELGRIDTGKGRSEMWSPQLSADGRVLSAGDRGTGSVYVVDLSTGAQQEFPNMDRAWTNALSPDGAKIALASKPGRIGIYDVASGDRITWVAGSELVAGDMAWSPNGRWLLAALESDSRVWDVRTGDLVATLLPGQTAYGLAVAWSRDSRFVGASGQDGWARVWGIGPSGAWLQGQYGTSTSRNGLLGIAFGPDGDRLMVGSFDVEKQVTVFDITAGGSAEVSTARSVADWAGLAVHPNGNLFISSRTHPARVVDAKTGKTVGTVGEPLPEDDPDPWMRISRQIALNADGTRMYAASAAGYGLWDTRTGEQLFAQRARAWWPENQAWSADGRFIAVSGFHNGSTMIYDADGTNVGRVDEKPNHWTMSAAFSPDGKYLATARGQSDVQLSKWGVTLWDWRTGERLWEVQSEATAMSFTPDGILLIASTLGPFLAVDGESGRTIATMPGNIGGTTRLAVSPDGSTVATGGRDGLVRLWDTATWTQTMALAGHQGELWGVGFAPDGRTLATTGQDGTTRVWALELDDLLAIAETKVSRQLTDLECRQYLHVDQCPSDRA